MNHGRPAPGVGAGLDEARRTGLRPKPFDVEYLITLCEKARREIALLRIEDRLEERTHELRESEERWRNSSRASPTPCSSAR